MAAVEEALVAVLSADAGVTALAAARIFPAGGRQGAAYPYATFQRISTSGAGHLDGPSNLDWPRLQIDCWAETAPAAMALAEAVNSALDGQALNGAGLDFYATRQDLRGPSADEQTRKFRVSIDYYLWHERN
ncbi:MAG: DUF3168 domain-containing protein [Pseudomonadota bacterium]